MPTGLAHWIDDAHRRAYDEAYDEALSLWPGAPTSRRVGTSFGETHVVSAGDPAGEPVVLIHAASLSATQWYPQIPALAAHHVHAVDILGDIGRSAPVRPMSTRADAASWLAEVFDGLGLRRATLVGASFGGFLSMNLAVHAPARVRALALLAPAATLAPFGTVVRLLIRMGSLWSLPSTVRPGLRSMMGGGLPDERVVRQMERGVAGFRYDRRNIFPTEIPDEELRAVACPTLVLLGDRERIYDPGRAAERARALLPEVRVELLPGVGHLPSLQAPEVTNRLLVDFLAGAAADPPGGA